LSLLDEFQGIFRVIVFIAAIISIFHWNGRSSAFIKILVLMTSELLALLVPFLIELFPSTDNSQEV